MKLFRGRWILLLIGGVALVALLNAAMGFLALKRLEKKAGSPIRGTYLPHLLSPAFTIKDPSLDWQGRFQVLSGTVRVRYNPSFLLPGWRLHTRIGGRDLTVRFGSALAESYGFSEVKVDRVEVDMSLLEKGPPDLRFFEVDSPTIKFHLIKEVGHKTVN